jgi:hypothetical protein
MRKMWKNFNLALSFIRGFLYLSYFLNSHLTVSLLAISLSFRGGFFVAFRGKRKLDNREKKSLDNYNCGCPKSLIQKCPKMTTQIMVVQKPQNCSLFGVGFGFLRGLFLLSPTRFELADLLVRTIRLPARELVYLTIFSPRDLFLSLPKGPLIGNLKSLSYFHHFMESSY